MKLIHIAKNQNIPLQKVEIPKEHKSNGYQLTNDTSQAEKAVFKNINKAADKIDKEVKKKYKKALKNAKKLYKELKKTIKKARKQRSDKGKKRGPYKPKDPNELLKKHIKTVNNRLADAQKHLQVNASNRMKEENKLGSKPAALQAVENWAEANKTKGFFKHITDPQGRHILQFDESVVDELVKNNNKEQLSKLKEMIEGNNKTDYEAHRTGMYHAKSLTKQGREEIHQDAYQTFIKQYGAEIGPNGMTREEYDELWELFNEYKKQLEDEEAYAIFYSQYQDAVKNGLLKSDSLSWAKWLADAVEQIKRDREAMI